MDRKSFVGRTIFPALCAAWRMEMGQSVIPDLQTKIEKLLSWIRNNWRLTAVKNGEVVGLNVRPNTVIGELFRERIKEEALRLMVVAKETNDDSSWLVNWRKALTNVREGLTADERDRVKAEVEHQSKMGLTLETKRKFRQRHMKSRFDEAAEKNLKEMDVLSLTFIIHRNKEGEMEVAFHDKVAYLLGLPESFNMTSQSPDQVRQFKNAIADYFVKLKKALERLAAERGGQSNVPNADSELMEGLPLSTDWHPAGRIPEPQELWFIGKEGYPVLKDFDTVKVNKALLEDTMRKYLSQNYCELLLHLATGSARSAVPWEQIVGNENIFFEKQYLPKKISLKPPRDMSKNDCVKFCRHIQKRQEEFKSMKDVFRFKMITGGRANTSPILPAMYADDEGRVTRVQTVKAKPQKRKPKIPNTGRIVFSGVASPGQLFQFESTAGPNDNGCNMGPEYPGGSDELAANADPTTGGHSGGDSSQFDTNQPLNPRGGISTEMVNPDCSSIALQDCTVGSATRQCRQRPLPRKRGINNGETGNAPARAPYIKEIYGNTDNISQGPANSASCNPSQQTCKNTDTNDSLGNEPVTVPSAAQPSKDGNNRPRRVKRNADARALEEAANHAPAIAKRQRKPTERARAS
ncbi:hypothetical protein CPC08DRAFT_730643 [Agrocybe pediades]|nr:hypothetical protein CPC08DRAFT_730643 [Agrocybe pediades]